MLESPSGSPRESSGIAWSAVLCWLLIVALVVYAGWASATRQRRLAAGTVGGSAPSLEIRSAAKMTLAQRGWAASKYPDAARDKSLGSIDASARSAVDKLAAVVMAGELLGSGPALDRIARLPTSTDAAVARAVKSLRTVYTTGPARLSSADREQLADELGWFGSLALTYGAPPSDPQRAALLQETRTTSAAVIALGLAALLAILLGIGGLITLIILFALGTLRRRPSDFTGVSRPRLLHAFVFWTIAWLGLSLVLRWLHVNPPMLLLEVMMAVVAFAVLAWPVIRGDRWSAVRRTVGLHRGAGVFIEIAWGIVGYLSGLPFVLLALILTTALNRVAGVSGASPITELPARVSWGYGLSLYLTAAVLAPVLEELLFRGALFGHLRRGHSVWLSTLIVSVVFAAIHPQGWTAIPVLATIGAVLALLREWRGSLIAPMTAHAINNGFLVTIMLLVVA